MQTKALAVLVALGLVLGSAFLFMKVIVEEISPTELVAGRLLLGTMVMVVVLAVLRRRPRLTPGALTGATKLAVLDSIIPFTLIAWAETRIDSGVASVIVSTMPMFTVLFASLTLPDERLARGGVAGIFAGFLGVVLLGGEQITNVTDASTLGLSAVVGAAASYGLAAVVARRLLCDNDALELTGLKIGIAAAMAMTICLTVDGTPAYGTLSLNGALALVALGVLSTSGAFAAFLWAVNQVGSVRASLVSYIIPVAGLVLGWLVLGETVSLSVLLGAALIIAGVATVLYRPQEDGEGAPAPMGCPVASEQPA